MAAHPILPWFVGGGAVLALDGVGGGRGAVGWGERHDHRRFATDAAGGDIIMSAVV